jgi:hypothetical protein
MPTVDIPNRICSHCGGTRWVVYNRRRKLVSGEISIQIGYKCAKQNLEISDRYRKNHIEKHRKRAREYVKLKNKVDPEYRKKKKERAKKYYCNNKEKVNTYKKKWISENYEKEKSYHIKNARKQCNNLSDYYVSRAVIGRDKLYKKDIPQELIELKRKQLLLTRQIKNNGKD